MNQPTPSPERQEFYQRISPLNMAPLWESFHSLISPEPTTPCVPYLWSYTEARPYLMESGGLITAKEAERRVLVLENPSLRGHSSITHTLYAGWQLVLPGEVAPCHRHAQSALRLIVEGSGAYTSVNGERAFMERGDFIVTGPWDWHDHGNDTTDAIVWLDGLDIPMVKFFDASFVERYPDEIFPEKRPSGDNTARYGNNMMPVGFSSSQRHSPVFHFPFARSREALESMRRSEEWDAHHGLKMEFINPVDGGPAMPTISTFIQLLPAGFTTKPYRSTDGMVYTVIEGEGSSQIGPDTVTWKQGDVFIAPSWFPQIHRPSGDAVLFSFSDRGVQQKIGLWKERKEE